MDKESMFIPIIRLILELSNIIKDQEMEHIFGRMEIGMKELGEMVGWKAMEHLLIKMRLFMLESLKITTIM